MGLRSCPNHGCQSQLEFSCGKYSDGVCPGDRWNCRRTLWWTWCFGAQLTRHEDECERYLAKQSVFVVEPAQLAWNVVEGFLKVGDKSVSYSNIKWETPREILTCPGIPVCRRPGLPSTVNHNDWPECQFDRWFLLKLLVLPLLLLALWSAFASQSSERDISSVRVDSFDGFSRSAHTTSSNSNPKAKHNVWNSSSAVRQ